MKQPGKASWQWKKKKQVVLVDPSQFVSFPFSSHLIHCDNFIGTHYLFFCQRLCLCLENCSHPSVSSYGSIPFLKSPLNSTEGFLFWLGFMSLVLGSVHYLCFSLVATFRKEKGIPSFSLGAWRMMTNITWSYAIAASVSYFSLVVTIFLTFAPHISHLLTQ